MLIFILLACLAPACAGTNRAIRLPEAARPVRKADPEALSHFIDAKLAQMRGDHLSAVRHLRIATSRDTTSATLYQALAESLTQLGQHAQAAGPAEEAVRIAPGNVTARWLLFSAIAQGKQDTAGAKAQLEAIHRRASGNLETLWRVSNSCLTTLGDTAFAVVPLEQMTREAPTDVRAYNRLLRIYNEQGRRANILATLDRVARIPNLNLQGKLYVAQNYERQDARNRAAAMYEAVLADKPREISLWVRLGNLWQEMADTSAATSALRRGLSHAGYGLSPSTTPAWQQIVRLLDRPGVLDTLLAEVPLDSAFVESLSRLYLVEAGNPRISKRARDARLDQALGLLDRLIGAHASRADLLARKGDVLVAAGRPGEARAAYRLALTLDSEAHYWLLVARTYGLERDFDQAIGILTTLLEQAPGGSAIYPRIVFDLGRAYTATGRPSDAVALYRKASGEAPKDPRYRFELGRLHALARQWDQAVEAFEAAEDVAGDDDEFLNRLLFELGRGFERAGRIDQCIDTFQRLLAREPDNHNALNYLGYTLAEQGIRLSEARRYIERALKVDPKNSAYLDSMGWVLFKQGQYQEASAYIERALKAEQTALESSGADERHPDADENLAIIHDHAGDAAQALGDAKKARLHWQEALRLDPGLAAVTRKLKGLVTPVTQPPAPTE